MITDREKLIAKKIAKINELKLATHKIELSVASDLEKTLKEDVGANQYSDVKVLLDRTINQIGKSIAKISVSINEIESKQADIRKMANELGVSYDNVPIMKRANQAVGSYKSRIKTLESIQKNIKTSGF